MNKIEQLDPSANICSPPPRVNNIAARPCDMTQICKMSIGQTCPLDCPCQRPILRQKSDFSSGTTGRLSGRMPRCLCRSCLHHNSCLPSTDRSGISSFEKLLADAHDDAMEIIALAPRIRQIYTIFAVDPALAHKDHAICERHRLLYKMRDKDNSLFRFSPNLNDVVM